LYDTCLLMKPILFFFLQCWGSGFHTSWARCHWAIPPALKLILVLAFRQLYYNSLNSQPSITPFISHVKLWNHIFFASCTCAVCFMNVGI
jgi:hypothetical protein